MSAIRLVVSDVDGTLANSDKALSPGNEAAVRALIAEGVRFTLISSRPPSGLRWIMERLGIEGPCGAFNGGTLFDRAGIIGPPHRLDAALAGDLVALVKGAGVLCWAFADGEWLTNGTDDLHTPREVKSAGLQPTVTDDLGDRIARVDKLVAVCDDAGRLGRLEAEARRIAGDRASVVRSQDYYLDMTAPDADKGHGVTALAKAFGVPLAATAVLGDQNNDLPMFARAGLSVAMGQASEAVKDKADAVAATNDDDGVADAIARFIRPRLG